MEKQEFKISIEAPREKVWDVLWNDDTYRAWTSAFSEGSRVETDWKKGSKVLFLNEKNEGMISTIAEKVPNEFMSFKHIGSITNGVEDFSSDDVKAWAGAEENYTLKTVGGKTELKVNMDITDEYLDYFKQTFPKALFKVKELAEQN